MEGNTHTVLFNHDEAIREAQKLLQQGKIIAIKGLGGFHIACDATNEDAVELLRKRKLRVDKPFAVMVPDISTARKHCSISEEEQTLLQSRTRPIVILNRLSESSIVDQIAPNQQTVGVMLPYTPLHYLLLSDSSGDNLPISNILVMTSGNLSEEPIAYDNEQARLQLSSLVDYFLMHNRPIETRCDDSVTRILPKNKGIQFSRRSRGYAPNPILVPWSLPQILATGAELKNTFCMTRENYAFISHHIGDLENYETFQSFEEGINNYQQLFRLTPEAIAYDLHPNYLSTQYALEQAATHNYPAIGVQHHHAHIAACMAENQIPPSTPVIGISFDGTGYGTDSAIWGGEILIADYCSFERYSHIKYYRLPGGDMAIRNPSRIAIAYLLQSGIDLNNPFPPILATKSNQLDALKSQLTHHINTPSTSSMGRLFDAVAALIGVRQSINYEAQAAIELESLVDSNETSSYAFDFYDEKQDISLNQNNTVIIDPVPVLNNIAADYLDHHPLPIISAKFHNGIANMVVSICAKIRDQRGITDVVLSGGVWQNQTLLLKTIACLEENNFNAIIHHKLPPNDGSISFGQAMIVYHQLNRL